ncbi:uncharacterized protein LOC126994507 [Eriocheir sinensis]|uniref:uncharacterized protein LOC126994507 n=1 Tax=Eriocheir sinensis TaxID=95602 RepID=UPI0021C5F177|nr:uncharacterized protein LOC126994507 [Eriocheir sinensis]
MSKKCAVKGCENRYRHRKSNLTFHRIPKDPEIRKKWVLACKSDDSRRRHDTDARVCCTHFEESSYEPTSLKYTLLNIAVPKNQRRLKAGAVPTILLPHQQDDEAQNGATDSCVTSSPHTGQHFETKDDATQNGATDSCVTSSPHTGQHFETKDDAAQNGATDSCVTSSPHTGQHFETKDDAAQNGATDSCVTSSPHTGQHFETKDGAAPNDATTSFENDSTCEEKEGVLIKGNRQKINLTLISNNHECELVREPGDTAFNHCKGVRKFKSLRGRWWFIAVSICESNKTPAHPRGTLHQNNKPDIKHASRRSTSPTKCAKNKFDEYPRAARSNTCQPIRDQDAQWDDQHSGINPPPLPTQAILPGILTKERSRY